MVLLWAVLSCWVAGVMSTKPNIIFFLTDDQDITLGGFTPMEMTNQLIAKKGATFKNAFATTPVCCPSRSTILTGLYPHNHKAINNTSTGGCYGQTWRNEIESKTYGAILHEAGYKTFYAGKYLNHYGLNHTGGTANVPVGWDWWIGLAGNSRYYNYSLSVNGTHIAKGDKEEDYLTDVLKEYSLDFLNQKSITDNPFLMVVATPSAHDPFTPANRHIDRFRDVKAPRTPNFNVPVNKTKHWLLRMPPHVLSEKVLDNVDTVFRNRWETLLSVDELVSAVITQLEKLGVVNNTYLVFSSDHGFHFGQFAMPWDKRLPYEFDIRIPLFVSGPNIPPGKVVLDPVATIDLAPTFLELAGVASENQMDGESFLSKINEVPGHDFSRSFYIEYQGEYDENIREPHDCPEVYDGYVDLCDVRMDCKCEDSKNNTYTCVRLLSTVNDAVYCRFEDEEGFTELYDIMSDPHQLNNLAINGKNQTEVATYENILQCCSEKIKQKKRVKECLTKVREI